MKVTELGTVAWAMESEALEALARRLAALPKDQVALAMRERPGSSRSGVKVAIEESVATIHIEGTLMRSVPAWLSFFGFDATETGSIKEAVDRCAADSKITSIVLQVNSPGGDAQGIGEAADSIHAASKKKGVVAIVDGMACSAAYWLASQADRISASSDAFIGSIGVYQVVEDDSAAAEKAGVKVHIVRSGEHKGMGVGGAPITDKQLASTQELVDGLADLFVKAVARGRKHALSTKEAAKELATGQVWLAGAAQKNGLVDDIESSARAKEKVAMDEKTKAEELAKVTAQAVAGERKRAADLRAAFPKHPTFATEQFESGATLEQARAAFADVLAKELEDERKTSASTRDELEKAKAAKPAPAPIAPAAAPPVRRGGDPSAATAESIDFLAICREYAKDRGCSMTKAMSVVAARGKALENHPNAITADPILRKVTVGMHADFVASSPKVKRDRSPYQRVVRPGAATETQ